jgi:large subunit ribosomal protein L12
LEYVYAALLLHKLGKPVTEENIKNIMTAAGATVDEAKVKALVASISEVNIDEAIKSAPGIVAASAPQAQAPTQAKPAEKKEEKKEEEIAGLGALFG